MFRRLVVILLLFFVVFGIVGCGGPSTSATPTPTDDTQTTPTAAPLHIKSVTTSVTPNTLSSVSCGSNTDFTFSSVIAVDEGSGGGAVSYTWNIGSNHIPGTVTFAPSEMSKTITYTVKGVSSSAPPSLSGSLSVNNGATTMTSTPAAVSGICSFSGKFQVTNLTISVSPSAVTGVVCGNYITFVYTATVTVTPNTNGGTVVLKWNFSAAPVTITFGPYVPGQTTRTITYALTGRVIHNQTFPPNGSIASSIPNVVSAGPVKPYGPCMP
jgi:hypothetical protein